VCDLLGIDPAIYFFETDKRKNAYRDAAATVLHQRQQEQADRQRAQQQARRH
jgi:hypothetical protein